MTKGFLRFLRGNAIALLALFLALGGTTYAAVSLPANSVGAKQLKKNAVINKKIKANAVTGAKVKNNSLTGADILESSLGKVPSAAAADNATHATAANTAAPSGPAGGGLTGTYPSPTLADGAVTPSKIGTIPAARLSRSTDQTLTSSSIIPIAFNTEVYDNSGMHNNATNNTRLVAPIAGIYAISAGLDWANGAGERYADVYRNGTTPITQVWENATTAGLTEVNLAAQLNLAAGDYLELRAYQNSGANLNVLGGIISSPHLEMHWVGP